MTDELEDPPPDSALKVVAVLLTVLVPLIALIVALIMRSGERRPTRRGFLRSWAIWSGAWLVAGWAIVLAFVLAS